MSTTFRVSGKLHNIRKRLLLETMLNGRLNAVSPLVIQTLLYDFSRGLLSINIM